MSDQAAREKFAAFTQSVAFQISLSRRMIELLREARDYGFPHNDNFEVGQKHREVVSIRHHRCEDRKDFVSHDLVTVVRSLERRGLIIMDDRPFHERAKGDRWIRLSLAGEIMCELLVEAGLLMEQPVKRGRRA
jgi:hypothetical protein